MPASRPAALPRDAGDILVHLFKPEARVMYALEKVWGELDEPGPG